MVSCNEVNLSVITYLIVSLSFLSPNILSIVFGTLTQEITAFQIGQLLGFLYVKQLVQ